MFTGLVEALGEVAATRELPSGRRIRIAAGVAAQLAIGDSVAVNGVCLTVVRFDASSFEADVSPQTLRVTNLEDLRDGATVNLERPLLPSGRLGGHFVQGHVDGVGRLAGIEQESDFWWVTVGFPADLAPYIVTKGSVAVDGISLTVAGLEADRFTVQIVPHTWRCTNLHARRAGDAVNIECDIIGKYVARALEAFGGDPRGATSSRP
ncbi:MAG: riboflavin synthase [Acidobacteria bacterium]|nr:riboflavin synthase [Acidobacteriota bacterium]